MSKREYSRSVEINLSIDETELFVEYVDAEVSQWRESLGDIEEYDSREELSHYIQEAIDANLEDLADTIVADFHGRVLGGASE